MSKEGNMRNASARWSSARWSSARWSGGSSTSPMLDSIEL